MSIVLYGDFFFFSTSFVNHKVKDVKSVRLVVNRPSQNRKNTSRLPENLDNSNSLGTGT